MPRRIILFAIFALLILAAPARAADSPAWTAWLHYGRHMTLIDSGGNTLRELDLPVPEGYDESIFGTLKDIGISADGRLAAYKFSNLNELHLIDLTASTEPANYTIDSNGSPSSPLTTQTFDAKGESFAVAYTPTGRDLSLNVLSTQSTDLLYSFSTTANALGLTPVQNFVRAFVLDYTGRKVNFAVSVIEPDSEDRDNEQGTTDIYSIRYFIWDMVTDNIQPDTSFSNLEPNFFPATGEIIASAYNPLFPTDTFEFGHPLENTLQVYDPTIDAVFPFYQADDVLTRSAFFVQNGERILAYLFHRDDPAWYWTLLERDGSVVDEWALPENLQIDTVKNTPAGFIYTASLKTGEWDWEPLPAVYEVNTRSDQLNTGHLVWQMSMKDFHSYFEFYQPYFDIAWVHSDTPVGPFKPWAQLADPVYAPTPEPSTATVTPTTIPMPSPLFHVGQTVRVQTIDGEILNLRAQPSRKSDILVYIEDDTQLELLEGPIEAEGFHWWRVHTPDGLEGWVVENDGELQTILPE
jgi:hypothetical protein